MTNLIRFFCDPFLIRVINTNVILIHCELQTRQSWSEVFILAAVIHYIGVVFYAIFASGELQSWAEPKVEEDQQMDEVSVSRFETIGPRS